MRNTKTEVSSEPFTMEAEQRSPAQSCELDKEGIWLTLVVHPLSPESSRRWRYRTEVEVVGRAVAVVMRLIT
jgi:hypothetical protein